MDLHQSSSNTYDLHVHGFINYFLQACLCQQFVLSIFSTMSWVDFNSSIIEPSPSDLPHLNTLLFSSSLNFPNNETMVIVERSLALEMVVTFGCQPLSRHFNTLMFSYSLSKSFPIPMRWFTICANLFSHTHNGFFKLQSENLVLLNQWVLSCSFNVTNSFRCYF